MKTWAVLSDCGLNGPWLHAVRLEKPTEEEVLRWASESARTTGYGWTLVLEVDSDTDESIVVAKASSDWYKEKDR